MYHKYLDQSVLRLNTSLEQVVKEANESLKYNFRGLVVHPCNLKMIKSILKDSDVLSVVVADFPHGRSNANTRKNEIEALISKGADEIDIVSSYQLLIDNQLDLYKEDLKKISKLTSSKDIPLKIILEVDLLTEELIKKASKIISDISNEEGINNERLIIKTKTGFAEKKIQNIDAVSIIKEVLISENNYGENKMLIKASGGIKTTEDTKQLINAGAHIIGTSSGKEIISG